MGCGGGGSKNDESDYYGIDNHDKSFTKWLVFGARGRLAHQSPPEITSKS
jgi:hypothetical protein